MSLESLIRILTEGLSKICSLFAFSHLPSYWLILCIVEYNSPNKARSLIEAAPIFEFVMKETWEDREIINKFIAVTLVLLLAPFP